MKRRHFLASTMSTAAAMATGPLIPSSCGQTGLEEVQQPPDAQKRYPATVPDTLDIVDMADRGLHGLTGMIDVANDYEPYGVFAFGTPKPYLRHNRFTMDCAGKLWESFPYLRSISGNTQGQDVDEGFSRAMLAHVADDGLFYSGLPRMTGWHNANPPGATYHAYPLDREPFANILGNARCMLAMMALHQRDGDEAWLKQIKATSDGLRRIAVIKKDYAYFPDGSIGTAFSCPQSGWRNTIEPTGERFGGEGSVLCYYGQVVRALTRWFMLSGDEQALDLAAKLVHFCQQPKMWMWAQTDTIPKDIYVPDHACFIGHVHGHLAYLRGLLEYAQATNNWRYKEFVRSGYAYTRKKGIARIGCFGEGCAVADMVALAIRLSDYGVGDYWDDVSQYVRNQFVEMQLTRPDLMREIAARTPQPDDPWDLPIPGMTSYDHAIECAQGTISCGASPTNSSPMAGICCVGNGTNAIYYAWESILRARGDTVQVNLLLNRVSAELDIDSHLPYQGRVILRNKTARTIAVRIPLWVNRGALRCQLNQKEVTPDWFGNYATFGQTRPGDQIALDFPRREDADTFHLDPVWWANDYNTHTPNYRKYACQFVFDTCVSVESPTKDPKGYVLYDRDHLKKTTAPVRTVERLVPDKILVW